MPARLYRSRLPVFFRRLDAAALATTLAITGSWLVFWFGD